MFYIREKNKEPKKIEYIIDEIIDQYLYADKTTRPWIIGFSGGKDSTVLLLLVWRALEKIKNQFGILRRPIHVVCNDTLVENPIIANYVDRQLEKIKETAVKNDLPIFVHKTIPKLEDSFWVNLIGRGYPVPNNSFRWCTERLKVKPTQRFITEKLNENGEAIILIGTRSDESATRARSIAKHHKRGNRLTNHPNLPHTYLYAPIKNLLLEEVWYIINTFKPPWDKDNSELFNIYTDASADDYECPTVVTDKSHRSCGQSRFGCWTCTVVKKDKSMSSLVNNGYPWLKPLLEFRDQLVEERNNPKYRLPYMRNGKEAHNGMGTYTPEYRATLLKRLLTIQKNIQEKFPNLKLISNQELVAIQVIWYRDFIFNFKVSEIYSSIFKKSIDMGVHEENIKKETQLLKSICKEDNMFQLIQDHLLLLKNKALLNRKRGLKDDLERRIYKELRLQKDSSKQ